MLWPSGVAEPPEASYDSVPSAAPKELKALDRTVAARIAMSDDPRALGAALVGEHSGLWRWRNGPSAGSGQAYRVVARIKDERVTILVVRVAHRQEVYR